MLKIAVGCAVVWVAGTMLWRWLSGDAWHWVTHDVWGWITDHPWWSALIAVPVAVLLIVVLIGLFSSDGDYQDSDDEPWEDAQALTYSLAQLAAMSPTGFEQACTELLIRDGFTRARRVGGAGDLGADVTAWDSEGRKVVLQCKQYSRPVGSKDIQTFNGTARPEHGADVATIVGLNGFTAPGSDLADRHDICLVDRGALARWAGGDHLYSVIGRRLPLT
ncbi:restriction endonuclease [Kitasatospora sp. NBC_00240]|uniref:restriction endonuclease n=1 Tax=Kitasatospora sp. NBC_00240 TaxID=2903567 RepID=UPI002254B786|nr:restriction endonuclease [Kitasatospora sp. NBC_00240]MCX5215728.1 restriction endonuclease [Kitasatospora sp. NBC_00240]